VAHAEQVQCLQSLPILASLFFFESASKPSTQV
jgi:hypothetical protein